MQEKYVSLNPEFAERETVLQRRSLFQQRLIEAKGGEVGLIYYNTLTFTFALCSYSYLRSTGFRVFPVRPAKVP